MFWIYGGSLEFGNAGQPTYDGSAFASYEDVIVVTTNYRTNGTFLSSLRDAYADWVQSSASLHPQSYRTMATISASLISAQLSTGYNAISTHLAVLQTKSPYLANLPERFRSTRC